MSGPVIMLVKNPIKQDDFPQLCRCCLSKGSLGNIFQLRVFDVPFCEVFKELFRTQITDGDVLPTNICEACIQKVATFYSFVIGYKQAQIILNAVVCVAEETSKGEVDLNPFKMNDNKTQNLDDSDCEMVDNVGEVDDSVNDDQPVDSFRKNDGLELSIESILKRRQYSKESYFKSMDSNTSKLYFDNLMQRIRYKRLKEKGINNIKIHPKRKMNVQQEIKTSKCVQKKPQVCTCKEVFHSRAHYYGHLNENPSHRPIETCPYCSKTFHGYTFRLHLQKHTKPFSCEYCSARFGHREYLKKHLRMHTGERPYLCEYCGKTFTQINSLRNHAEVHKNEEKEREICHECGRTFVLKDNLRKHMRRHENSKSKRFLCSECGNRFTTRAILKIHQRTHSGEKPFLCSLCGEAFAIRAKLKAHVLKHSGDPVCKICGKSFKSWTTLTVHLNKHTNKPLKCPSCNKAFTSYWYFSKHLSKHNKGAPHSDKENTVHTQEKVVDTGDAVEESVNYGDHSYCVKFDGVELIEEVKEPELFGPTYIFDEDIVHNEFEYEVS